MADTSELTYRGHAGGLSGRRWEGPQTRYVVLLSHGYGEHVGRYEYLAERLVADGAAVYAVDHVGHGRSEGERVLVRDFDAVVDDFAELDHRARREHPGLPVVLIGHSMGGMIAARCAQRFGSQLTCVVLSGPVLGRWDAVTALLAADQIPDDPIDVSTLSRDPAVGAAYTADPLVWHGPFKRPTLEALDAMIRTINEAGTVEAVPMLWLHGADDRLVPIDGTAEGWARIAPEGAPHRSYPGARHEIFNETNHDEVLNDVLAFIHEHV